MVEAVIFVGELWLESQLSSYHPSKWLVDCCVQMLKSVLASQKLHCFHQCTGSVIIMLIDHLTSSAETLVKKNLCNVVCTVNAG